MHTEAFAIGLLFGGFGLLLGALITFAAGRVQRADGGLGIWIAGAALVAVEYTSEITELVPLWVFAALGLLALGGLARPRLPVLLAPAAFAPGAVAIALVPYDGVSGGTRVAVGVLVFVAAALMSDFEQAHATDGFALWLFPVSALVPAIIIDGGTEPGWTFAGATASIVINVIPRARARVGAAGSACLIGAFYWIGMLVAADRAVRLAALTAGLGFLILEPISRNLGRLETQGKQRTPKRIQDRDSVIVTTALAGQTALMFFAVRVTAHSKRAEFALIVLIGVLIVATALARAFVPPAARRKSNSSRRHQRSRSRTRSQIARVFAGTIANDRAHRSSHRHSSRGRGSGRRESGGRGRSTRHRDGRDPV